MNEITKENNNRIIQTPEERAVLLDSRINANAQIAAESIVAVGRDLKAMRDEKLYIELGCESFAEYCETKTQIKQRQAYNFIKCYETYGEQLTSIQHLGITKLAAMTALDEEERDELIQSGDAEALSSRDLERRIEELQNKCEQLTMELAESREAEESESEKLLKMQNEELLRELEALKIVQNKQKLSTDEEKESLKSEIDLLKKQKNDLSKDYEKKLKEQIAEAEKKAVLQANAKKQAPPDSQKERVKFYCEECLRSFNSAMEALGGIENGEIKEKCLQAVSTIVKKMEEVLQ